jgi:hypothetical protein
LSFYHDIDNNELGTVNDLLNVLETVESLVIRYYVSGDINIKDSIYASGIREYHNDGTPDEILEEMVETVRTDDDVTGTDLVDALCSTEWSSKMSRQALRMIDSDALEAEEGTLITQKLNRDNNVVHNEHIFPSSPLLSGDDKYDWLRAYFNLNHGQPDSANFFDLDSEDYDLLEEGLSQFGNVITHLIEEEEDEQLEEIATKFSTILGNQILLWYETNLEISNQQYSTKLPAYDSTKHFDLLSSSQYLRTQHMQSEDYAKAETHYALRELKDKLQDEGRYEDIVEEFISSNEDHNFTNFERICETVEEIRDESTSEEDFQENLQESLHSDALLEAKQRINQLWTFETTTRNLVIILRKLCSVLEFDAVDILNDEFGETEFEYRAQREINRKRGVIGYNYAE